MLIIQFMQISKKIKVLINMDFILSLHLGFILDYCKVMIIKSFSNIKIKTFTAQVCNLNYDMLNWDFWLNGLFLEYSTYYFTFIVAINNLINEENGSYKICLFRCC